MANNYQGTFSDFDYDYIELAEQLGSEWKDMTWKNDTCPKYTFIKNEEANVYYDLWFDYADLNLSETKESRINGDIKRFGLTDEFGDFLLSTDDWDEMKKAILEDKIIDKHYDTTVDREAMNRLSEG